MAPFPEAVFTLSGDPREIRSGAGAWTLFAYAASSAATDLLHVNASEFIGDEADTYRDILNLDLPPHLDTTAQAWTTVATALTRYADRLADLQAELGTLRPAAWQYYREAERASADAQAAAQADHAHATDRAAQVSAIEPGDQLTPDTYTPAAPAADAAAVAARAQYQATIDRANTTRAQHAQAVAECTAQIDAAAATRFAPPPGFFARIGHAISGWITEHADVLKAISGVLKQISGIAGMLAAIPALAPIMGPLALGTGMAATGIDAGIKLATGEGSWTDIALDAGLMLLPGVGKAAKPLIESTRVGKAVNLAAATGLTKIRNSAAGSAYRGLRNSKAGEVLIGTPAKALNAVNDTVADAVNAASRRIPRERPRHSTVTRADHAPPSPGLLRNDGRTAPNRLSSDPPRPRSADQSVDHRPLEDMFRDGRTPTSTELAHYAERQGWTLRQNPNGPPKYLDENGIKRMTIKRGSARVPGSEAPHVELRDATDQRITPNGDPVPRNSPGNHTPIVWDHE